MFVGRIGNLPINALEKKWFHLEAHFFVKKKGKINVYHFILKPLLD